MESLKKLIEKIVAETLLSPEERKNNDINQKGKSNDINEKKISNDIVAKSGLKDANGKNIVTNKLVQLVSDKKQRGQIKNVTVNSKVQVQWLFPQEKKGTSTAVNPGDLEIYSL